MSDQGKTPPQSLLASPTPPQARGLNRFAVGIALLGITLLFAILAFVATSGRPQTPVVKEVRDPKSSAPDFLNNPPRRSAGEAEDPRLAQLLSRPPASASQPFGLTPAAPWSPSPPASPESVPGSPSPSEAPAPGSDLSSDLPPGAYRPFPGVRLTRIESSNSSPQPPSWEAAFKSSLVTGSSPSASPTNLSPGSSFLPNVIRPEDLLPPAVKANDVRPGSLDPSPMPSAKTISLSSPMKSSPLRAGTILPAGTVIKAILLTSINTQQPGAVAAQISTDNLDVRGRVLIPRGSRLFGTYENQVSLGDSRVAIVWSRLQIHGRTVDLPKISTAAPDGSTGQPGSVDHHSGLVFGRAVLLSLISAGAQLGQPRRGRSDIQFSNGEIIAGAGTQELTTTSNEYLKKSISVTPTIEVPAGSPITVLLPSDLSLPTEE